MPSVLVAGRIDVDAVIRVARHPRPGEEIGGHDLRYFPGGKGANQAVAAARVGADVILFGCVGDDSFGTEMISFLDEENINTQYISKMQHARTGMAFIAIDEQGQNTIVYDASDVPPLDFQSMESIQPGDVLVSQFDIPDTTILKFLDAGHRRGARNVFNAAPAQQASRELLGMVDILIVNEFELACNVGGGQINPADHVQIAAAMEAFERPQEQALVVTLGEHGAVLSNQGTLAWIEAAAVVPVDTTGAGDAFTGALAAELCTGSPLEEAVAYACAVASVSVTRHGASVAMPYWHEVRAIARPAS